LKPLYAEDLNRAAKNLQIGGGIADRMSGLDATEFITDAEDWADDQISEFIGVPLKPTPALGSDVSSFDPSSATTRNYPRDFIQAVTYRALSLLLNSEYFENSPNLSEAGKWAMEMSDNYITSLKTRLTTRVGSGRIRNPNPFAPPSIMPRETRE
jgi:hypothetical protein